MMKVGIHENVFVNKVTKNDKGQLVIQFQKADQIDPLAALNGTGTTSFEPEQQDIIPFDIKVENFGKKLTMKEVRVAIADYKDPLDHILSVYLKSDQIKWDMFRGVAINGDNMEEMLTNQEVVTQIQNNINNQFTSMMSPFAGVSNKPFRILFVRSSAAKHYPSLRKKFLDTNPFIESMEIPVSKSKVKYTKYEKEKGLDNPNPIENTNTANQEDAQRANALFSK